MDPSAQRRPRATQSPAHNVYPTDLRRRTSSETESECVSVTSPPIQCTNNYFILLKLTHSICIPKAVGSAGGENCRKFHLTLLRGFQLHRIFTDVLVSSNEVLK